jgi:hypothetical protein
MADNPLETMRKFPVVPHHEVRETFADHVGAIMFDGSILRIDFAAVRMSEPVPPALPAGERHVVARLVLSMNGAIDLINQMSKLAGQLTQAGVVKNQQGQVPPQAKPS